MSENRVKIHASKRQRAVKNKTEKTDKSGVKGKSVARGAEAGRRDRTFQRETCRRRTKMSLFTRGFHKRTTAPKPTGRGECQMCENRENRETFPVAGRTRTHRLDLELLPRAALMWSYRCLRPLNTAPFPIASVPQNTSVDHHKPSVAFPEPPKCTHLSKNRVFV